MKKIIIFFILYRATVLLDYSTFWVGITSNPVQVRSAKGGPSVSGPTEFGRSENVLTFLNIFIINFCRITNIDET